MKISIVTLPLNYNYGGMLQAYALSTVLKRLNHQVELYNSQRKQTLLEWIKQRILVIAWLVVFFFSKSAGKITSVYYQYLLIKGQKFANKYIKSGQSDVPIEEPDLYIVGSDQIWRRDYLSADNLFFVLDFLPESKRKRCFSYAASFGVEEWGENLSEINLISNYLKDFKAISVREDSGVEMCNDIFGVDAVRMPDPTFLLNRIDYDAFIDAHHTRKCRVPYIASYILDDSQNISNLVREIGDSFDMPVVNLISQVDGNTFKDRLPISVAQWLYYLKHCDYVITDSFHACVFSIIFNKSFICLGNKKRGMSRFHTLLKTYSLQDRLVVDASAKHIINVLKKNEDWQRVNNNVSIEAKRGIEFIYKNLK